MITEAIANYDKTNKVKAMEFYEKLKIVVDKYNNRDSFVFTSDVVKYFISVKITKNGGIYRILSGIN